MPQAISSFIRSFSNTERGATELGYSLMFALQDLMPRSCDAAHLYHAMMMDIDESSRFAIAEIRSVLGAIATNTKKNSHLAASCSISPGYDQQEVCSMCHRGHLLARVVAFDASS